MDLIAELEAEQVAELGKDIPDFKAGDTIRVGYKVTEGTRSRVQNYEGVCISRKNGSGIAGSFTVRKISFGEGVERVFPLHSTNIDSITVVRRGRVQDNKCANQKTGSFGSRVIRGKWMRSRRSLPVGLNVNQLGVRARLISCDSVRKSLHPQTTEVPPVVV